MNCKNCHQPIEKDDTLGSWFHSTREDLGSATDEHCDPSKPFERGNYAEPEQDHTFRVTHERTGKVAYEGPSYIEAADTQTRENSEGLDKLWRLWLIDLDGIGVLVKTQVG